MLDHLDNLYYQLTRPRHGGLLATVNKAVWIAATLTVSALVIVLAHTGGAQ